MEIKPITILPKHYLSSGLSFMDYMIIMLYEYTLDLPTYKMHEYLGMTEKTFNLRRVKLIQQGYLTKVEKAKYELTDKLYPGLNNSSNGIVN